jgi:glycerol-3-phosphate cytidylyltransferase
MKRFNKEVGRVGFVASCFDLLHAGHCLMLKDASRQCDYLIAGLQTDPTIDRPEKNKPVMSLEERKTVLESIRYVDEILMYETEKDLNFALENLKPDVRVLGDDYIGKPFTGEGTEGGVFYHKRSAHSWSTTSLRKRIFDAEYQRQCRKSPRVANTVLPSDLQEKYK